MPAAIERHGKSRCCLVSSSDNIIG